MASTVAAAHLLSFFRLVHAVTPSSVLLHRLVLVCCALVGLAACSSTRQTSPPRTATEQLLISTAGDRAAERLAMQLPPGKKVFVDPTNFAGMDGKDNAPEVKYVLSVLRDRILRNGGNLVNEKDRAEIIVEARAGPVTTPELALYKRALQEGVAKLAITAYDAKEGTLIAWAGPEFGYSHRKEWVLLLLFGWTDQNIRPDDPNNPSDID
jgi:hypothetical protein